MNFIRRAHERVRSDESGLGMIELLVAIVISGALLAIVASFFLTTTRATISSDATRVAATTAGNVASQVSSAIRFATPNAVSGRDVPDTALIAASGRSVTLYSLLDSSPDALTPLKVRYEVVDGQWKESRWIGTTSGGYTTFSSSAPTRSRQLGGLAVPQSGADQQPFVFLDEDGSPIGDGGSLTAAQIADVRAVRINVIIRGTDTGPVTTLTSDVGMPNLGYRGVAR